MRVLTPTQLKSFSGETLTIATLITVTQLNGKVVKITDHDVDIQDWRATFGLDVSAITLQLGGTGQTASVTCMPDKIITEQTIGDAQSGGGITFTDLESGQLDGATIDVFWVDWSVDFDPLQVCTGYITDVKYGNSAMLQFSINTPLNKSRPICKDVISMTCRADFGDPTCGIDLTNMIDGPHVFAPIDAQNFLLTRDEHTPPNYYNNGTCYFASGQNKGLGYEIQSVSKQTNANPNETITLKIPTAFDVAAGDAIVLYPGCDKILTSGCTFWNNVANFQGEPYIVDNTIDLGGDANTAVGNDLM